MILGSVQADRVALLCAVVLRPGLIEYSSVIPYSTVLNLHTTDIVLRCLAASLASDHQTLAAEGEGGGGKKEEGEERKGEMSPWWYVSLFLKVRLSKITVLYSFLPS